MEAEKWRREEKCRWCEEEGRKNKKREKKQKTKKKIYAKSGRELGEGGRDPLNSGTKEKSTSVALSLSVR